MAKNRFVDFRVQKGPGEKPKRVPKPNSKRAGHRHVKNVASVTALQKLITYVRTLLGEGLIKAKKAAQLMTAREALHKAPSTAHRPLDLAGKTREKKARATDGGK
jgi:hypothetical protein